MKKRIFTLSTLGLAVLLAGCNPTQLKDNTSVVQSPTAIANAAAGTDTCMKCHGDSTVLNDKIQNARDTWMTSVHAKGITAPLKDSTGAIIGHESEGPDSFYANAGGCQVCHTKEGFIKKVTGVYTATSPAASDSISAPSSLTCFTCHKPHTNGNFDLVIPASKAVTLTSGAVYDKNKGSICADCHQSRVDANGPNASIVSTLKGSGAGGRFAGHYGVQGDMLLGKGGAEYAGKTYSHSTHKSDKNASCVTCHMTYPDSRFSGSSNLAGHSFNAVGIVHGAQKGNAAGCVSCHTGAKSANATATKGHLQAGDAYFTRSGSDKNYDEVNTLLTALVDPTKSGDGLLQSALRLNTVAGATASIVFTTDGRYKVSGLVDNNNKTVTIKEATATDEGSPKARFAKALFNYSFVWEDKSFGNHNATYTKQLLWDAANDLTNLGATTSVNIGTRP